MGNDCIFILSLPTLHIKYTIYMVTEATIILNGKEKNVNVINKDGNNVKLRNIQDSKITIGYVAGKPTVTVRG